MSKQYFLGIDPGVNGGLAAITSDNKVYAVQRMPNTKQEVYEWFRMFTHLDSYCMLEQVSGYIGEEHPGSRMFEFGKNYGYLEMALVANGFTYVDQAVYKNNIHRTGPEYDTTLPQRWQRGLSLRTKEKGESDTSWKNYLKEEAQKIFPRLRITKYTSDALLIAHYCKSIRTIPNNLTYGKVK